MLRRLQMGNMTWDYLGWIKSKTYVVFPDLTQKDWNQTLMTLINQAKTHIKVANYKYLEDNLFDITSDIDCDLIICGKHIFEIIKSFEYFEPNKSTVRSFVLFNRQMAKSVGKYNNMTVLVYDSSNVEFSNEVVVANRHLLTNENTIGRIKIENYNIEYEQV